MQWDAFLSHIVAGNEQELIHLKRVCGHIVSDADADPTIFVFLGHFGCGKELLLKALRSACSYEPTVKANVLRVSPDEAKCLRSPIVMATRTVSRVFCINANDGFHIPMLESKDAITRKQIVLVHLWNTKKIDFTVEIQPDPFPYLGPVSSDCDEAPAFDDPFLLKRFMEENTERTFFSEHVVPLLAFHNAYKAFCLKEKHPPLRIHSLREQLAKLGISSKRNFMLNTTVIPEMRLLCEAPKQAERFVPEKDPIDVKEFIQSNYAITNDWKDAVPARDVIASMKIWSAANGKTMVSTKDMPHIVAKIEGVRWKQRRGKNSIGIIEGLRNA